MSDVTPEQAARDMVWIPAVPLPLMGWRTDRCSCGEKFRGRRRRERYEIHYHREHLRGDTNPDWPTVAMTRDEARRLYERVNADHLDAPPERTQP